MRQPNRRPMGTSLIEVMVTLTVLLALGMSAAMILRTLTEIGSQSARGQQQRRNISRLARVFRADIESATQIELETPGSILQVVSGDQQIRYQIDEDANVLNRVQSLGDQRRFEQFELPPGSKPSCERDQQVIRLHLNPTHQASPMIIDARQL